MTERASTHTVALLDDHVLVVDGLARWIDMNAPDFTVVAALGSWEDLVEHESFPPDVVIMARKIDSPSTLRERIAVCSEAGARVVVMSTEPGPDAEQDTLDAGAYAFIPKSRPAEAVVDAARRAVGRTDAPTSCPTTEKPVDSPGPDEWQRRVLRLYATGQSTVDIAIIEGVRFDRVREALKQIRSFYAAQGRSVATRDDLLRRAAEDGYLSE